ncbi:MAG: hypothetical protein M3O31_11205 [Acidobacteriota bacterium]|nr:hypothetical protein [Acidobacteriota bacterium]
MHILYLAKHSPDDQAKVMEYLTFAEGRLVVLYEVVRDMAHLNEETQDGERHS